MDCAPYCHLTFGSNQAFFFNFGILCVSNEVVRTQSCGVGWTIEIVQQEQAAMGRGSREVKGLGGPWAKSGTNRPLISIPVNRRMGASFMRTLDFLT